MCRKTSERYGFDGNTGYLTKGEPLQEEPDDQEEADEAEDEEAAPEPDDQEEEAARKDAAIEDEVISMLVGVPITREARLAKFREENEAEVKRLDGLLDDFAGVADRMAIVLVPNSESLAAGTFPVPESIRSEMAELPNIVIEVFGPVVDRLHRIKKSFQVSLDRLEAVSSALQD